MLLASSNAFTALKLLGACYLVFLGLRSLLANRRRAEASTAPRTVTPWTAYRQGLATNVLNPKVALFFVAMLPQFVEPGEGFVWRLLALSGVFIAMGLVWLAGYTIAIHAVGRSLDRASIRRWFERVSGVVLVALGVRLALARD